MRSPADLDYRFGWRWLLPLHGDDQVFLLGFAEHETEFWKQSLACTSVTHNAAKATMWLINGLPPSSITCLESEHIRTVCVIGSSSVVVAWRKWMTQRFAHIRDYTMVPPNTPRVVVPLGVSAWTVKGLSLHRPGRFLARLAVTLLKGLVLLGIDRPLRSHMLCIANEDASIPPQGANQAELNLNSVDAPKAFALYLGTPDDNRKTVILPLAGTSQVILKYGESPKAQASLRIEGAALKALNQTGLASHVPVLLDVVEDGSRITLFQEYRVRRYVRKSVLRRMAIDYLVALSKENRSEKPLGEVLNDLNLLINFKMHLDQQLAYSALRVHLEALATNGTMVWGHRSHGDFAPWNCAWTSNGFFVFDWEESREWDVALGDVFYFVVAPALHVALSCNPQTVETEAFKLAEEVAARVGQPVVNIDIYWALWLLQRMSWQPAPLYSSLLDRLVTSWS